MTLTTHAITGAALATMVPNYPALGFIIGFASHYFLDALPHWSYSLKSMRKDERNSLNNNMIINKDSLVDFLKIGIDGILGLIFSFILIGVFNHVSVSVILMGAIGGMFPDALQFFYWKWKHEPLVTLQRMHNWAHTKIRIDDKPILGVLSQIFIILIVVFIFK
jgi:hypothetical protein